MTVPSPVLRLLSTDRLERVEPNVERESRLVAQAHRHLATASARRLADPEGAFVAAYDAARKALAAFLGSRGMRVTARGGHHTLRTAVRLLVEQEDRAVIGQFEYLRVRRIQVEYSNPETAEVRPEEVDDAIARSSEIVLLVESMLQPSNVRDVAVADER